jgi:hypothetical protein
LKSFKDKQLGSYWFQSGTPQYLVETLKRYAEQGKFNLSMLDTQKDISATAFNTPIESMTGAIPLLYQSGYLTLKDYNREDDLYTLDIPNAEVRIGLMQNLLPLCQALSD